VTFCRQLKLPVLGVIENMSGFTCPKCGERIHIFSSEGGKNMAEDMGVPYLGTIPIETEVVASGENGRPIVLSHPNSEAAAAFDRIVRRFIDDDRKAAAAQPAEADPSSGKTVIAVPVANGVLGQHFGHCEQFALFEVAADGKTIGGKRVLTPPPHEPGVLPRWLHEQGADVIIAGGMGAKAQNLFTQNNIKVVVGAPSEDAEQVVKAYLSGTLETGANVCDH